MPSTFFGLNIGVSGLYSFQAAINTTANNISNVQTKGYSRQNANLAASDAIRVTTKYGSMGSGVNVISIKQERDLYYDAKYWENSASYGYFEEKLYYIDQVEQIFKDDIEQQGFATIFSKMFNGLDTLKNNAGDVNVRNQFINQAQGLATYFNSVYESLAQIQEDCNEEIKTEVEKINSISEKISLLNKEINKLETGTGAYANELRDQRANLVDELSRMVDVSTKEYPVENKFGAPLGGTRYIVEINGQTLVDNYDFYTLECVSSEFNKNQTDTGGMYEIVWSDTGMKFAAANASSNGSLKALFDMRDGDNADNMKGTITDIKNSASGTNDLITIKNLTVDDLKALNIPAEKGSFVVNNVTIDYDSWTAEVDADGKISEITFQVNKNSVKNVSNAYVGYTLSTGSGVDSMGIPYYQAQMNQFIRTFAEMFNDIEKQGQDLNGNSADTFWVGNTKTGTVFKCDALDGMAAGTTQTISSTDDGSGNKYDTYYRMTAENFAVNGDMVKNPNLFGATANVAQGTDSNDLILQMLNLQSGVKMFRGDKASAFLETLISDVTVDANKAKIYFANYSNLNSSIGNMRTSISGVDEDEEALNLVKFQNAYNLNAKVISVMSELYDKLINETGVS